MNARRIREHANWRKVRLRELFRVKHGFAFKSDFFSDVGAHVLLTPGNFREEGGFKSKGEKEKHYSGPIPEGYVLDAGSLLVAMTEQAEGLLGSPAIVPEGGRYLHNQRLGLIVDVREDSIDRGFLYYLFNSRAVRQRIRATASGVKIRHTSPDRIGEVEALIPTLPIQQRIAGILSAYDDLIENNTRRIQILEKMAQAIYREWFVHFRFPGHEKVKRVDSPMGRIPQGWMPTVVPEAVDVNARTLVPRDGSKPFVPMTSLSNGSMLISDIETRDGNSGSKFKNGDTLFARITPCLENGKTGFVQFLPADDSVAFGSTEFVVLRSRTLNPEFVYLLARSPEFRNNAIKSMSGATGRQRVQEACFNKFILAQPPRGILDSFATVVRPKFRLIHNMALKNANLRRTRDLLLPKLISGQIDVSGLDDPQVD